MKKLILVVSILWMSSEVFANPRISAGDPNMDSFCFNKHTLEARDEIDNLLAAAPEVGVGSQIKNSGGIKTFDKSDF